MLWLGLIILVGLVVVLWALCACVVAARADARRAAATQCPATGEQAPTQHELMWDRWLAEELARPRPKQRKVRPSIELDADLVDRIDSVAAWSGCTRHELVSVILTHWLASWRRAPR